MLFLLLLWLSSLAVAISEWAGIDGLHIVGGYLALITAILAFIVSAADMICSNPDKVFGRKIKTSGSSPS